MSRPGSPGILCFAKPMKLAAKRNWIALLAGLFLFSNVAGAVQRCVHASGSTSSAPVTQAMPPMQHEQAVDDGDDDCCNTAADEQGGLPDCCAVFSNDHRSATPPEATVPASMTLATHEAPNHAAWSVTPTLAARPAFRIAGPPPRVLFKNFRI